MRTAPAADGLGWRPAAAVRRAVLVVALVAAVAVATGRADLVAVAAPLAVVTVLSLTRAVPAARPAVSVEAPSSAGQDDAVEVAVHVDGGAGAEVAVVRLPDGVVVPQGRTVAVALGPDGTRRLVARARPTSWGRVTVARPDLLVVGRDGLVVHGPAAATERRTSVLPSLARVPPVVLPPRPAGLVGAHRTRRPGEGSDLLDVREFAPGDRIRRVDWRVSARTGRLHVRRTAVDVDADVVLCLDTRMDLSADAGAWAQPPGPGPRGAVLPGSSLDVAVRAAASVAAAHLRHGDRVALVDLTRPRMSVRPGSGRRQLLRIRRRLSEMGVHASARRLLLRPGVVPSAATVVVLSPLLDEPVADLVASLRRRGGDVVALDVLPDPLRPPRDAAQALALRLVLAERAERLAALAHHGVLVQRWDAAAFAAAMVRRARHRGRRAS